jgi:hypothetical protein
MPSTRTAVRPSSTPRTDTICAVPPTLLLVRGISMPGISRSMSCTPRAGDARTCSGDRKLTVAATLLASIGAVVPETSTADSISDPGVSVKSSACAAPPVIVTLRCSGSRPIADTRTSYVPSGRPRST